MSQRSKPCRPPVEAAADDNEVVGGADDDDWPRLPAVE